MFKYHTHIVSWYLSCENYTVREFGNLVVKNTWELFLHWTHKGSSSAKSWRCDRNFALLHGKLYLIAEVGWKLCINALHSVDECDFIDVALCWWLVTWQDREGWRWKWCAVVAVEECGKHRGILLHVEDHRPLCSTGQQSVF